MKESGCESRLGNWSLILSYDLRGCGKMSDKSLFEVATAGHHQVPRNWMPATRVRPFIFEDPVVVWLEYHGNRYGFQPDTSPYEFLDFIAEKSRQFEEKWIKEMASDAVVVCYKSYEARLAGKVRETIDLIRKGTPLIVRPALWWAPERIYGVPDLLVHTSWLRDNFPDLLPVDTYIPEHYVVFDIKFTTKLDRPGKAKDLRSYAAQVRIYSYILGHLQGFMPQKAYLITRDRICDPLPVDITSTLGEPLDQDLAAIRDQFVEIKLNGARYVPWRDDIVRSNLKHQNDRWRTAKDIIAREKMPGGDPALLYQINPDVKRELAARGYPTLDSMLREDPQNIPFEKCRGLGPKKSKQIRAILQANRSGFPLPPPVDVIPVKRQFEFYIDFEYFTNVNVDFDTQWPTLDGCEMVFMIGTGWEEEEKWFFMAFVATAENHNREREMFEEFLKFLETQTKGAFTDNKRTALYHWTSTEVRQVQRMADRHHLPDNHPLRRLPWYDLQRVFLDGPCAVPGAWGYGLKEIAKALGKVDPRFDPQWPGDLDKGLLAMVMGWKAYQSACPLRSQEMITLVQYLEADCKALWKILKWIRSHGKSRVSARTSQKFMKRKMRKI